MFRNPTFTFRNLIRYSLVFLAIILLVAYALWQARLLIVGPTIIVKEEPPAVSSNRVRDDWWRSHQYYRHYP